MEAKKLASTNSAVEFPKKQLAILTTKIIEPQNLTQKKKLGSYLKVMLPRKTGSKTVNSSKDQSNPSNKVKAINSHKKSIIEASIKQKDIISPKMFIGDSKSKNLYSIGSSYGAVTPSLKSVFSPTNNLLIENKKFNKLQARSNPRKRISKAKKKGENRKKKTSKTHRQEDDIKVEESEPFEFHNEEIKKSNYGLKPENFNPEENANSAPKPKIKAQNKSLEKKG